MSRVKKYVGNEFYVDGNTVRRLEAAPDNRRELERRREEERQEELRRKKRVARRNQERALQMSRGYVAFLTVAVIVSGIFAGTYIKIQSDITNRMKNIASLESQITELRADNDAVEKRINTSADLNTVKDIAMNQLGMTYASPDQIIYYSVDKEDYMNQYSDIPNN
ncbi:MAG: hypothetical protein ACI4ES_15275 [Roseburia sp.]